MHRELSLGDVINDESVIKIMFPRKEVITPQNRPSWFIPGGVCHGMKSGETRIIEWKLPDISQKKEKATIEFEYKQSDNQTNKLIKGTKHCKRCNRQFPTDLAVQVVYCSTKCTKR